jgi:hypothetical protein
MLPASDLSGSAAPHVSDIGPAHRELNKLRKHGLTPAGQKWLETALDPFHDLALECEGYPDFDATCSIVQGVRVSRNLSAPSTTGDTGTWDCHIASTPYNETWPGLLGSHTNGYDYYVTDTPPALFSGEFGMVTASSKANADPAFQLTWPGNGQFPETGLSLSAVQYAGLSGVTITADGGAYTADRPYTVGRHRVVAAGFEVINTTPPLYRGGLCTVYRQNANHEMRTANEFSNEAATNPRRTTSAIIGAGPPPDVASALNLPGSRQWAASEGAYIPLTLAGDENPFVQAASREIIMTDDVGPGMSTLDAPPYIRSIANVGFGTAPFAPAGKSVNTLHQSGAYFTGLSKNTTLTVSLRVFIERAPTRSEPDLVPLARPSPAADPVAWMVYTESLRLMPPGVILAENFLGGWFKQAVSNVHGMIAPTISKGVQTLGPIAKKEMKRLAEHAVEELVDTAVRKATPRARPQRKPARKVVK